METIVMCGCVAVVLIACMTIRECIDAFARWVWRMSK